jgi:hypothetical protein
MPKVFVSYSWEGNQHRQWVKELAVQLRTDGVNVILDQWDLILGDSLTLFMESSIRDSDFVIIICTPTYKTKSDNRHGGVGYEESIITAEILYKRNTRKFIPVLKSGAWRESAPTGLLDRLYVDLSSPASIFADDYNYLQLLSIIHNVRINPPPVGVVPVQRIMAALSSSPPDESDTEPTKQGQRKTITDIATSIFPKRTISSTETRNDVKPKSVTPQNTRNTTQKTLSVDEVMEDLKNADSVAECKIADYNLTTFTSESDRKRIEYYLFNGDQRQRNYATLYMRRKGHDDIAESI